MKENNKSRNKQKKKLVYFQVGLPKNTIVGHYEQVIGTSNKKKKQKGSRKERNSLLS